jgi:hypothetical protein
MRSTLSIDDYTLASFIGGTLSERSRRDVIEHLIQDADAREWLKMVGQALEAAQSFVERQHSRSPKGAKARPPMHRADRPAVQQSQRVLAARG